MKIFIVVENGTAIRIIRCSDDGESIISKLRERVEQDHPGAKCIPCSQELAQDLDKVLVKARLFTNQNKK